MRRLSAFLSTLAAAAIILGLAVSAAGATPGTAVYSVDLSANGVTHSYTVTETVSAGSNASFDTLFLAVASSSSNFTYSRSINSSMDIQPFVPSITNQSFTYAENGTSVSANIASNGTVPVTFEGKSYSLTSYAYSASVGVSMPSLSGLPSQISSGLTTPVIPDTTVALSGSIATFPSGLVYSVRGGVPNEGSFSIVLLSTTLPLSAAGPSTTAQVASVGVGAGAIVSAIGLSLGVRHRHNEKKSTEAKPEHWVD